MALVLVMYSTTRLSLLSACEKEGGGEQGTREKGQGVRQNKGRKNERKKEGTRAGKEEKGCSAVHEHPRIPRQQAASASTNIKQAREVAGGEKVVCALQMLQRLPHAMLLAPDGLGLSPASNSKQAVINLNHVAA